MSLTSYNPLTYLNFFTYAVRGLRYALKHHISFSIQVIVGFFVIGLGFYFGIARVEWLVLLVVTFAVLVAELLNTSIETTLDYMAKEHNINVKVAKDVAAGAVLLMAIGSVVVGGVVFLPYLF